MIQRCSITEADFNTNLFVFLRKSTSIDNKKRAEASPQPVEWKPKKTVNQQMQDLCPAKAGQLYDCPLLRILKLCFFIKLTPIT
jgi:hypothetical protein